MTIQIEKGIPIPPAATGTGGGPAPRYPFRNMEVGDSFTVPLTGRISHHNKSDIARVRVAAAAASVQKNSTLRFTTRVDREQGVVRCWRVA